VAGGVAQCVGPKFKPHYHKKRKREKVSTFNPDEILVGSNSQGITAFGKRFWRCQLNHEPLTANISAGGMDRHGPCIALWEHSYLKYDEN
jgi:hypothetical protein